MLAYIAYNATAPDGTPEGRLFDPQEAELFPGNDPDDGELVWEHLYLTEKGVWIKNTIRFGSPDTSSFDAVPPEVAHAWLKDNNHQEAAERYFERPKGGRPKIGERLITTAPARMHNEIAELAEMYAEEMPDTIRRLLGEALEHRRIIGAPGSRQER